MVKLMLFRQAIKEQLRSCSEQPLRYILYEVHPKSQKYDFWGAVYYFADDEPT